MARKNIFWSQASNRYVAVDHNNTVKGYAYENRTACCWTVVLTAGGESHYVSKADAILALSIKTDAKEAA